MYVSDQKVARNIPIFALLVGPWLGVSQGIWGWVLDIALLFAVFEVGRVRGFRWTTLLLTLGYGIAVITAGGLINFENIGFLPWVGLLSVWGREHSWSQKSNLFWCLVLSGIIGVFSIIPVIQQGFVGSEAIQKLVNTMLDQYRQTGLLASLNQQGISETEIQASLQQTFQLLFLFVPGFAALGSIIEYSLARYLFTRWFTPKVKRLPISSFFRLPWYALWGVNLGIASYLIGDQWSWTILRIFGMNLMFIYAVIAFGIGCSIFLYNLRSPLLSGFIKAVLILMSFLYFQVTIISLILLGLFDLVLNFRRLPE
ncbi:DUF2232 domain-containing protein [Desulfitobacterium sp. Sab5]|uniref:DUF2232 domain-containing protein n=1 Tax=Desulfitobacterium nosdiversum TaxID=3375356 RepID=UPI003CEF4BA8